MDRTEDQFREHIKTACSTEGLHLVVSFSRKMLGQTGDGHFSPIAGYHAGRDLVLVMDTVDSCPNCLMELGKV